MPGQGLGVIERFSEDVDLGVDPTVLGFDARDFEAAPSKTRRRKLHDELQQSCCRHVGQRIQPILERRFRELLGTPSSGDWLAFHLEERTHSPELRFAYPATSPDTGSYITKTVRLEFGSLTDQHPRIIRPVQAMLTVHVPDPLEDTTTEVVALGVERTFWEKATIPHAEFHRPSTARMPDRYARHYADFARLWEHELGRRAATDRDMLLAVAKHKAMFFDSAWASYQDARPGSLRLSPAPTRIDELRNDFHKMLPMFLGTPPDFDELLVTLAEAERAINAQ